MISISEIEQVLKESKIKYSHNKVECYSRNFRGVARDMFVFKYKDRRYYIRLYADEISIETSIKTSAVFSVNRRDKINPHVKYCRLSYMNIYICSYFSDDKSFLDDVVKCIEMTKDYLLRCDFQRYLFDTNEGFMLCRNHANLALKESTKILLAIDLLSEMLPVIEENFPDKSDDIDTDAIPKELHDLIPVLKKWAISDDAEREEKVTKAAKGTLTRLVNRVTPKMEAINRYLDSFGNEPLSEEATMFASLAELVCELQLRK